MGIWREEYKHFDLEVTPSWDNEDNSSTGWSWKESGLEIPQDSGGREKVILKMANLYPENVNVSASEQGEAETAIQQEEGVEVTKAWVIERNKPGGEQDKTEEKKRR